MTIGVLDRPLTQRERIFQEELISNGFNQTQAALKAYKCTPNSARAIGCKVAKRITRVSNKLTLDPNTLEITNKELLSKLTPEYILSQVLAIAESSARPETKLKAYELVGSFSSLGLWSTKVETTNVTVDNRSEIELDNEYLQLTSALAPAQDNGEPPEGTEGAMP